MGNQNTPGVVYKAGPGLTQGNAPAANVAGIGKPLATEATLGYSGPFPINSPYYPLSLPQYLFVFFQWVATYSYAILGGIAAFVLFLVTWTLFVGSLGTVANNLLFIPLEIQIFDPAYARARSWWYQEQMAHLAKIHEAQSKRAIVTENAMYWLIRWVWVLWFCFLTLVVGAAKTIISFFDSLGVFVLFLVIWAVWTSATFNYPLALNIAATGVEGAEKVTNFSIFGIGGIFHVGNALIPLANTGVFYGVEFLRITVVEAANIMYGGSDSNPLFQAGSVFSDVPNMIAVTSTFGGRRLQAQPIGDVFLETIHQIALALAFVNGIIYAISLIIYNLVFVLVFSILQGNLDIFIAAIQIIVCAFMSLGCLLPQVTQYIVDIVYAGLNFFGQLFTVTIDVLNIIPDAGTLTPPSVACSGGALASVPCTCAVFFTGMQQCGTSSLECRERDGVFYEYKVYPDGHESLINQGVDRATVCPNTRRLSEDYHGYLEDHVGRYVPCTSFKIANASFERCSDHLFGHDETTSAAHRQLAALNIKVPLSSKVQTPPPTPPPTLSALADRLAKAVAENGDKMNRELKTNCDFSGPFDYPQMVCHLKLVAYTTAPVIQKHLESRIVAAAPKPHGRKLSDAPEMPAQKRLRDWAYTIHALVSSMEIRAQSGRSLRDVVAVPDHVTNRIAKRLTEVNAHVSVPHFHAYERTATNIGKLIDWAKSMPTNKNVRRSERRLLATRAPTFPKYGIWTGKQCPDNTYKCPTDDCVVSKRDCPPPTSNSWSQNVGYQWLQLQLLLDDLNPVDVIAGVGKCWSNYDKNPSTNPFLLTHFLSRDPNVAKNFVYCFPLVREIDTSILPDYVSWNLYDIVENQCTGGECQCNGYWSSVFETGVNVIPGVPYFTVANLVNGLLVFWTLTCQILFAPGRVFSFMNYAWQAILYPFYSWGWVSVPVYYAWWDQGQGNYVDGVYVPADLQQILTCAIYNFGYFGYLIVVVILFKSFLAGIAKAFFDVFFEIAAQIVLGVQVFTSASKLYPSKQDVLPDRRAVKSFDDYVLKHPIIDPAKPEKAIV